MMNILFVGSAIPKELCIKHKGNSVAGNKMQLGIIQALSQIPGCNIQTLSTYPIAAYPREKVLGMRKKELCLSTGEKIVSIPFINIFILKQLSQMIGLIAGIIRWHKAHKSGRNIIICFNAYPEWSLPVLLISKICRIHKICILADLPISVIKYGAIRQLASNIQIKTTLFAIDKFDGLIVLNKEAQKRYAPNLPYCVIDGAINLDEYPEPANFGGVHHDGSNKKIEILFTGALIEYNGIINLLDAIKKIKNKDVIFKFYGDGPLTQYIIDESLSDERIQYKGLVSNSEILKKQMESSFLINPRPANELVSQVTFPSKILEYMMSGIPVLTTRLNGLIDKYTDYLFFIDDNPDNMAADIEQALSMDKELLILRSRLAYKFVSENKTWDVQAKPIFNFLDEILKTK